MPHSIKHLSWLALFSTLLLAEPVHAETPTETTTAQIIADYEAADDATRTRQLIFLSKTGQHELAAELMAQAPLQGPHAANRTLYIEGLIIRARGDQKGAVEKFRAALASDPKLTLVRSDLAATLMAMDEDDSAKHHLKLLAADAPTPQDAVGIRAFIDQIDAKRPYQFSGYISVAPSTNVNNGSSHKTVYSPYFGEYITIDKPGRKKSGVGGAVGGSGAFNHRFNDHFMFIAAGQVEARIYDDFDFNSYSFSQTVEMRHTVENGYFGLGAVASQSLTSDASDLAYLSYGPRISGRIDVTQRDIVTGSATFEWRDSQGSSAFDSTALMFDSAWTHAFNSSFNVTVTAGFDDVLFDNPVMSYSAVSGGLSIYKELPFGVTADVFGHLQVKTHDEESLLAGKTQQDYRISTGITLTKRDLNILGFAPAISYQYLRNMSNIAIYDNDAHSVDFRLTKDF